MQVETLFAKYHKQSHGESFLEVANNNLQPNGLYLFDEPEAVLSPQRQLTLLMDIYTFDQGIIHLCKYEETESYLITEMFLNNREAFLHKLLKKEYK